MASLRHSNFCWVLYLIRDTAMKTTMCTELAADQYDPEALFARLCIRLGVKSYSALGLKIGLSPSAVSKVRNRKVVISSEILLKIHDATDIPLRELRRWMGDTRPFYSPLSPSIIRGQRNGSTTTSRVVRAQSAWNAGASIGLSVGVAHC